MNPKPQSSSSAVTGNPQSTPNPQSEIQNSQSHTPHPEPGSAEPAEVRTLNPEHPSAGRPRKLDEISRREICALVSVGCGIEGAAQYVGCAASTIRREAQRNEPFNEELRRAYLAAELTPLNAMRRAAATHWRAAAWLLERTNPQRFARQDVRYLKPDQLQNYLDGLEKIYEEEVTDPEMARRIIRRFDETIEALDRELLASRLKPFPRPRPQGRRGSPTFDPPTARPT